MVLGGRERRLLSETTRIEEELMPGFVRPMLGALALAVALLVVWAALTRLPEVARAPGSIIPSGQIKVVQHLDGGIVEAIAVEENRLVEEGQELLRMDGAQALADLRQMDARRAALHLRAERLDAFLAGRKPEFGAFADSHPELAHDQEQLHRNQTATIASTLAILDNQIAQRGHRLKQMEQALAAAREHQALAGGLAAMREDLGARRLVNRATVVETQRAKVTADSEVARLREEIDVVGKDLAEIRSRRVDTVNQVRQNALGELGQARAELAEVEENLQRMQARVDRLVVKAPIGGHVQDLKVTTLGQVMQPGAVLMQIVPDRVELEAEVRVSPRDIGYVRVGQPVNLRVSSYDYTRFGVATGKLKRVTASSVVGSDGQAYFRAWVTLDQPYVGKEPGKYRIQPGMGVDAEIRTGEKTLLAYLSKPVIDAWTRAFRER